MKNVPVRENRIETLMKRFNQTKSVKNKKQELKKSKSQKSEITLGFTSMRSNEAIVAKSHTSVCR